MSCRRHEKRVKRIAQMKSEVVDEHVLEAKWISAIYAEIYLPKELAKLIVEYAKYVVKPWTTTTFATWYKCVQTFPHGFVTGYPPFEELNGGTCHELADLFARDLVDD